jgi:hypothetical protein
VDAVQELRVRGLRESGFRKYLQKRKLEAKAVDASVGFVKEFEEHLKTKKQTLDSASLDALKEYISLLIAKGKNSQDRLIAIARYCYITKKTDLYIYFTSILGAISVLPEVGERLGTLAGEEAKRKVFKGVKMPPLGASQEEYPKLTSVIAERMETELPPEKCREVMTWNYHHVPASAFKEAKKRFEKAASIDEYLKDEHRRLVEELESYMKKGQPWYEQEITPEVLEFVKKDQEINTGLRKGDRIYKKKIPYAPKQFLKERDPTMRKYYMCHCQLVRTALRDGKPDIPPTFCYCSAGFEKVHFDVIFGEPVEAELLETPLKGDPRCRFAIKIPKGKLK